MRGAQPVQTGYQGLTPRQQLREPGSEPHLQGGPSAGEPSATTAHPKTRRRQAQGPSHSLHAHPVFTRVHAHPHIHAHVRQFSNTLRTLVHSRGPAHSRLCSHLHAHTVMLMSHACAVSHILTSRRIDSHPHTPPHTDSHVDTSMYSNPHSHIHVHTHSCTHPCIHTALTFPYHTFACTPTLTFTRDPHTFTLMRTHVFADIHLHTPYILMFLFTLVLTDTGIRDMQTLAPHALLIHIHTH